VNPELVGLRRIETSEDMQMLLSLVKRHYKLTGSKKAKEILDSWDLYLPLFWRVAPHSALTEEGPMTVVLRHLATVRGHA
jgi:glutamate synthase (ferredoxin)